MSKVAVVVFRIFGLESSTSIWSRDFKPCIPPVNLDADNLDHLYNSKLSHKRILSFTFSILVLIPESSSSSWYRCWIKPRRSSLLISDGF